MHRITVGAYPDGERKYLLEPYSDMQGASIIYYPEVPLSFIDTLLSTQGDQVSKVLSLTANI